MKSYLANGLFSLGDRRFNEFIAESIREALPGIDLYVPQENDSINNKSVYASSQEITKADLERLVESDFLVAIIDGVEIDSGVSAEIGYASAKGIPVLALYTDVRQQGTDNSSKIEMLKLDPVENQFAYRNLFVVGLIKLNGKIFNSLPKFVDYLKNGELKKYGIS